ncbi:TBC1 domain family member 19-like [Watersipora subatra]|uniref:TBC1 domain family member 19-like n=1 Tax=Watersipora subatra TaxID=2589382 RepID=UPI00355B2FCC
MDHAVEAVVEKLSSLDIKAQALQCVYTYISQGKSSGQDIEKDISNSLKLSGCVTQLENKVYKEVKKLKGHDVGVASTGDELREPLSCVRRAQQNWEKRIAKSLNTMCTELNMPLAKKRSEKDIQELSSHWTEVGTMELDVSKIRPVYGPKDFLEVLINVSMPNKNEDLLSQSWGLLTVPIHRLSINELRVQYHQMSINHRQTGVDDEVEVPQELFANDRFRLGKKVVSSGSSVLAQEYCKRGCPSGLRADLWQTALDVNVTNVDRLYYDQLKQAYLQHDLLTDLLYYKDIKLTATNDDQYFVFEDYIFMVLLPFSRDTHLLELTNVSINTPPKSFIRGKLGMPEYSVIYPPNGIIPFYGFSMLVAPLCYVYDDVHMLYYMFREMYMRYFYKLHVISSERQSILGLASTFESILQVQEPQLFFHMKNHDIHPLRIVFKWLMRAYSGFLSSEEVLRLWDKILAYDSLEILSVLAVAIFSFRKLNLLQVRTQGQAEAVLADLTTVKVTPLIQLTLFSK